MTFKPAALRERARRDIDEAVRHYRREAGAKVAHNFARAFEYAVKRIREQPAAGSPRYATELDIPDEMASAKTTGVSYQTRLLPSPMDLL